MEKPLYAVYTYDEKNRYLLGIASGEKEDILPYFDSKQIYGLTLEPLEVHVVPEGYSVKVQELRRQKSQLEQQIRELDKQIEAARKPL